MTGLLDRLAELHAAATPGPWRFAGNYRQNLLISRGDDALYAQVGTENAALIVAAVNALPALLQVARAGREALLALVDEIDHYVSVSDAPEKTLKATHELRSALASLGDTE